MDPISLVASAIAIVQATSSTYTFIRSIQKLPDEFYEIARYLPLVSETFRVAQVRFKQDGIDKATSEAIKPVIEQCEKDAITLHAIVGKIKEKLDQEGGNSFKLNFYCTALRSVGRAHRVEALMQSILRALGILSRWHLFQIPRQSQEPWLEGALNKLANVETSVPDSMVAAESYEYNLHNESGATGHQYNNNIEGGTVIFGGNFSSGGGSISFDLDEERTQILQKLYIVTYEDRMKRNRYLDPKQKPCEWFLQHPCFLEWRKLSSSGLLLVTADPGCGKSVLARYLVDSTLASDSSQTTCYFFFKQDFPDQTIATNSICCILHQLFSQKKFLLSEKIIKTFKAVGEKLTESFQVLWNGLLSAAADKEAGNIICIIDAFDECQKDDQSILSKTLAEFYATDANQLKNLKFLVTSRPYASIERQLQPAGSQDLPIIRLSGENSLERGQIAHEISNFIRSKVDAIALDAKYADTEKEVLFKLLVKDSNRTYLWVTLVFPQIEKAAGWGINEVRKVVRQLPDVDAAYERILEKSGDKVQAKKILQIIVAAERPLTLSEMNVALSVSETVLEPDGQDIRRSIDLRSKTTEQVRNYVIDCCGLFVHDVESKLYLIHQTAREFLIASENSSGQNWKRSINMRDAHKQLSEICVSYLLASCVGDRYFASGNARAAFFKYSAMHWNTHFFEADFFDGDNIVPKALKLHMLESYFSAWFKVYWRTKYEEDFVPDMIGILSTAYFGHCCLLKSLLKQNNIEVIEATDDVYGQTPLLWAAKIGHHAVVQQLLNYGADVEAKEARYGRTPLSLAAENGHHAVVQQLLNYGADVEARDDFGQTPLSLAAENGQHAVVQQLLNYGADVETKDNLGKTPLSLAAKRWQSNNMQQLIDRNPIFSAKDSSINGQKPLPWAAETGHYTVVKQLLNHGADAEADDTAVRAPVWYQVIKRLIF